MTAKEWFSRGRRLDRRIESLQRQRREEWERITSVTARPDGDPVDGTRDPHKFDRYAVLDGMIGAEIDELLRIKCEIKAVIAQLDDMRYRDVLDKRYVDGKPWEQIAVEMHYGLTYIRGELHGHALKAAAPLIPKDRTQ